MKYSRALDSHPAALQGRRGGGGDGRGGRQGPVGRAARPARRGEGRAGVRVAVRAANRADCYRVGWAPGGAEGDDGRARSRRGTARTPTGLVGAPGGAEGQRWAGDPRPSRRPRSCRVGGRADRGRGRQISGPGLGPAHPRVRRERGPGPTMGPGFAGRRHVTRARSAPSSSGRAQPRGDRPSRRRDGRMHVRAGPGQRRRRARRGPAGVRGAARARARALHGPPAGRAGDRRSLRGHQPVGRLHQHRHSPPRYLRALHGRGAAEHGNRVRLGRGRPHRHECPRAAGSVERTRGHARPDQLHCGVRRTVGPTRLGGAAGRRSHAVAAPGPTGRQRPGARRTERLRHRKPLRLQRHADHRDHLGPQPPDPGPDRRHHRGRHPGRRGHQHRQLRRPPARQPRPG